MSATSSAATAVLPRGRSLWSDAWAKLKHNRAAVVAACVIAVMTVLVLVGPLLSSFTYDFTDWSNVSSAPSLSTGHFFGTDTLGRDLYVVLGDQSEVGYTSSTWPSASGLSADSDVEKYENQTYDVQEGRSDKIIIRVLS